jgi:hypothetical protein
MATTINSTQIFTANTIAKAQTESLFSRQAKTYETYRFAFMTILITIQSCLGSIATQLLFQSGMPDIWFMLCAAVTMATNAVMIAQGSGKLCLALFYISIVLNSVLIAVSI